MSSRRGIGVPSSCEEAVEEVAGVVRAGAGLGVVLDRRRRHVAQDQALDRAVVEVEVGELGGAEIGLPAHRLVTLDPRLAARALTAKPWFCEVMSIRPVARSLTGWLAPRWPKGSLKVSRPTARQSSWWPRQIPKTGRLPTSSRTVSTT